MFTSPVLEGTKGVLHVSHVYLNGLSYDDLEITFKDGRSRTMAAVILKMRRKDVDIFMTMC